MTIDFLFRDGSVNVQHVIYSIFAGNAAIPFYYIIVLIQLTVLTPLLIKVKRKRYLYLVSPVYLIAMYVINFLLGYEPEFQKMLFPAWIIFYLLGMDCRVHDLDNLLNAVKGWMIPVALFISIIESLILNLAGYDYGFVTGQVKFGNYIYCCILSLTALKYSRFEKKYSKVLISLGDSSYGIFYIHMLVLIIVRKVLTYAFVSQIWFTYYLACGFITICISLLIIQFVKKMANKLRISKFLYLIGF